MKTREQEFPGVGHYRDRHGKLRWRYRHKGFTVNLGTEYGSPDFLRRYTAAVKGERLPPEGAARVSQAPRDPLPELEPGQHHLTDLITEWYKSARFKSLGDRTRNDYRRTAENLREEFGAAAVEELTRSTVMKIMQRKADKPEGANKDLRVLRLMYDHAVDVLEWVDMNPAREVKKFQPKNKGGFHTWTDTEIDRYYAHHKEGTLADLAMTLMLYTGAARADAVRLGPESVHGGRLRYSRKKMETRNGVLIDIPIHPDLMRRLQNVPEDNTTFLQTEAGAERSPGGLGNMMRKWCDAAGLPDCTAHGLRKACARRLAEAGATPHEIMSVTGHQTLTEVERYTREAQRAGLADTALEKLNGASNE